MNTSELVVFEYNSIIRASRLSGSAPVPTWQENRDRTVCVNSDRHGFDHETNVDTQ